MIAISSIRKAVMSKINQKALRERAYKAEKVLKDDVCGALRLWRKRDAEKISEHLDSYCEEYRLDASETENLTTFVKESGGRDYMVVFGTCAGFLAFIGLFAAVDNTLYAEMIAAAAVIMLVLFLFTWSMLNALFDMKKLEAREYTAYKIPVERKMMYHPLSDMVRYHQQYYLFVQSGALILQLKDGLNRHGGFECLKSGEDAVIVEFDKPSGGKRLAIYGMGVLTGELLNYKN